MKNSVNCWEVQTGQSAAKPRNGKVQRLAERRTLKRVEVRSTLIG